MSLASVNVDGKGLIMELKKLTAAEMIKVWFFFTFCVGPLVWGSVLLIVLL